MFSNLDLIDWDGLGYHVYPRYEEIPRAIRDLLSPDDVVREEARGFLLGQGQDFGDIYDTTPRIIPFCLEVLAMDGAPGKSELMIQLSGQGMYIADAEVRSVHMMDLCLQTYEALRDGLNLYLELLTHGDRNEKLAACELLQYMTDDLERLIPELLEQFAREADEEVQVSLLYCLKQLFGSLEWPRFQLKEQYAPKLKAIVDEHPVQIVRVAAARVSVELVRKYRIPNDDLISRQVAMLLAQEFLQPGTPMHWSEDDPLIYQENIVRDLARLSDTFPLLHLLDEAGITAKQAQLLARGLLCQALAGESEHRRHWQQIPSHERRKEGDFYQFQHIIQPWQLKTDRVHAILQAIIDKERVWERPSNLFSYFYGLPDSRDELRRLVESINA
jgi:hypothetical protein